MPLSYIGEERIIGIRVVPAESHHTMSDLSVLLVIPPLTQLNTPYPSTAYLTGFLRSQGYRTHQADVGIEMVLTLFSRGGLSRVFAELRKTVIDELPGEARQMLSLDRAYVETINPVISFLQGRNPTLASRICQGTFLPQGPRFSSKYSEDQDGIHRSHNQADQAKHLATLYLEDLADLVQATIAPHFALSRYAESIAMQANSYDRLEEALAQPMSLTDEWMVEALWRHVDRHQTRCRRILCAVSRQSVWRPSDGSAIAGQKAGDQSSAWGRVS